MKEQARLFGMGCDAFTKASTGFSLHPALTFVLAVLLCFSLLCMSLLSSSSHIAVQSCIPLLSMTCRHVNELQASPSAFLCLSADVGLLCLFSISTVDDCDLFVF